MLKVYSAPWCPHCMDTIEYLKAHDIAFQKIDIEAQPQNIIQKIIEVNGGDDWAIPTLEYNGRWRPGKEFDAIEIEQDLKALGVI